MASQVLNGSGPVSYTNNTGENVRVIINYLKINNVGPNPNNVIMSFGSASASTKFGSNPKSTTLGKNLGYVFRLATAGGSALQANNAETDDFAFDNDDGFALPTEVMLAPNETFSISMQNTQFGFSNAIGSYNIVIIPEGG